VISKNSAFFLILISGSAFSVERPAQEKAPVGLRCQGGTTAVASNTEFWCRRMDDKGTSMPHGIYRAWYRTIQAARLGESELQFAAEGDLDIENREALSQPLKIQGQFDRGKKAGTWTFYFGDGEKAREETYLDGKLSASREWDQNGKLVREESLKQEGKTSK
jgi:hypothetical protein